MFGLPHRMLAWVRGITLLFVLLACALAGVAQTPDEEFHISRYFTDEFRPMLEADSSVFYRVLQRDDDSFAKSADYNLSFVGYARRGIGYRERTVTLDGVPLRGGVGTILSRLGLTRKDVASAASVENLADCGRGGVTMFKTTYAEPFGARSVGCFGI